MPVPHLYRATSTVANFSCHIVVQFDTAVNSQPPVRPSDHVSCRCLYESSTTELACPHSCSVRERKGPCRQRNRHLNAGSKGQACALAQTQRGRGAGFHDASLRRRCECDDGVVGSNCSDVADYDYIVWLQCSTTQHGSNINLNRKPNISDLAGDKGRFLVSKSPTASQAYLSISASLTAKSIQICIYRVVVSVRRLRLRSLSPSPTGLYFDVSSMFCTKPSFLTNTSNTTQGDAG